MVEQRNKKRGGTGEGFKLEGGRPLTKNKSGIVFGLKKRGFLKNITYLKKKTAEGGGFFFFPPFFFFFFLFSFFFPNLISF